MNLRLKTAIVGSYPKPHYLYPGPPHRLLLEAGSFYDLQARIGPQRFSRRLDRAVRTAVADQNAVGLDFVSDGEERRDHYIWYVMRGLKGVDFATLTDKTIRGGTFVRRVPTATARIEHTGPVLVRDFQFLQGLTGATPKVNVPGPITVADTVADQAYGGDMEALALDYAEAVRAEVGLLLKAGCRAIQFDDPVLLRYPEHARNWALAALERCFRGYEEQASWFVHVCRGYPDRTNDRAGISYKADQGGYEELLGLLSSSRLDVVSIEGAQGTLDLSILPALGRKTVMLGVLDVGSNRVESQSALARRVEEALRWVPPERLMLAPDCGMFQLSRRSARAKLRNMTGAAALGHYYS